MRSQIEDMDKFKNALDKGEYKIVIESMVSNKLQELRPENPLFFELVKWSVNNGMYPNTYGVTYSQELGRFSHEKVNDSKSIYELLPFYFH